MSRYKKQDLAEENSDSAGTSNDGDSLLEDEEEEDDYFTDEEEETESEHRSGSSEGEGSIVDEVRRLSRRLSQDAAAASAKKVAHDTKTASLLADLRGGFKNLQADDESDGSPVASQRSAPSRGSTMASPSIAWVKDEKPEEKAKPQLSPPPAKRKARAKGKAKPKVAPGHKWLGWSEKFPHWYKYPLPKQFPVGNREDWAPHHPRHLHVDKDVWDHRKELAASCRLEERPLRRMNAGGSWCRAGVHVGDLMIHQTASPSSLRSQPVESMPRGPRPNLQRNSSQPVLRHIQWGGGCERPMPPRSNSSAGSMAGAC
mmetsp:Transcript_60094/g.143201  ORF Transcript_60094/g.143201 Transcript_60094/m.143201 type:complete len:315 (+) Transcript_60094:45-989(+)